MKYLEQAPVVALAAVLLVVSGCQVNLGRSTSGASVGLAARAFPVSEDGLLADPDPLPADREIADLTEPGVSVRGRTAATVIDSRTYDPQIAPAAADVRGGESRQIKVHLPLHARPGIIRDPAAGLADFPVGTTRAGQVIDPGGITRFSALDRSGWNPPDPSVAVGPDHVVATVNMTIGWYTKDGTQQFEQILGSQGSPGFFESAGAGTFTFDPKCFYDHYAGRFVVMALEVYSGDLAYITIAVSDDSDPNGIWYKYRTDAVISINGDIFWWDYPGFGFDRDAYYVTGNLFGFYDGFAGAGFRIFDKADMLTGAPVDHWTLLDADTHSVQVAQHFGDNPAPFFVRTNGGGSMQIFAIENPTTGPVLVQQSVEVPGFTSVYSAPAPGGDLLLIDERTMNVHWRDGRLYATHHVSVGGVAKPRWYEFDTGEWPVSGSVVLTQSGNADPGPGIEGFFPAIYSDGNGAVAMVFGTSSSSLPVGMSVTARKADDPAGTMAERVEVRQSPEGGSLGRWGDYYDIAIDPTDGVTFWVIGQTQEWPNWDGWGTWIASFRVDARQCPADLNGDGLLDLLDINAFVAAFQLGDLAVDFTGDGILDLMDIQAFIAAFVAGCP